MMTPRGNRLSFVGLAVCVLAAAAVARTPRAQAADAPGRPAALADDPPAPQAASHSSASKAHVDPLTGRLTSEPPQPQPQSLRPQGGTGASEREGNPPLPALRRGVTAGGGLILDLQGQFQNELRLNVEPDGRGHAECSHKAPQVPE